MMHTRSEKRPTVLVIDDSKVILDVAREALESAGYQVLTHDRPAGCVALILQEKPDLVLMDVNMPTLQGDKIVGILGSAQPDSATIVLLHSSLSADALEAKAKQAGAHGYICKTSNTLSFIRQINVWLRRSSTSASQLRAMRSIDFGVSAPPSSGPVLRAGAVAPRDVVLSTTPPSSGSPLSSGSLAAPRDVVVSTAPPSRGSPSSGSLSASQDVVSSTTPPSGRPDGRYAMTTSGTLRIELPAVLLVDDDMLALSSYRRLLQRVAPSVEFALSGAQALKRILSPTPPHAVICDLLMPGINGITVYERALEAAPEWRDRFVFVTGARSDHSLSGFLARFTGSVFYKPVAGELLLEAVQRCLARGRPPHASTG
jgi:CheY-like chemotaxis protein